MFGRKLRPMLSRKVSGADWKSGKARKRSRSSNGKPAIVELPSGEDLTGREGFMEESKLCMSVRGSEGLRAGVGVKRVVCRRILANRR